MVPHQPVSTKQGGEGVLEQLLSVSIDEGPSFTLMWKDKPVRGKRIMVRRSCLVIGLLISLVGCHHAPSRSSHLTPLPAVSAHQVTQIRSFAAFSEVMVQGRINVNLHTGAGQSRVVLHGDALDLKQVLTVLKYNMLSVSVGAGYPQHGQITLDIYTRNLNAFTYKGFGVIRGSSLTTRYFDLSIANTQSTVLSGNIGLRRLAVYGPGTVQINRVSGQDIQVLMEGQPKIQLVGLFNVGNLDLRGDGFFSGYWIKNDRLVIKEHGHVHLQLAGVTKLLEVTLWDHAEFNGRYLRAYRAFIKTHNHAIARISAVRRQHTLASDSSDIYYYNLPEMKTDFMAFNGAVLDMRDWNLYFEQEYTRLNEQY